MYLISILLLIITSALMLMITGVAPAALIDFPSFVFILLICLPLLASTGLIKDFNNAFKYSMKTKDHADCGKLRRSITATSFVIKLLWAAGVFWTVFNVLCGFGGGRQIAQGQVTAYIAVMVLPLIYASFFVLLLMPIKMRLELRLEGLDNQSSKAAQNNQNNQQVSENNKTVQ